MQPHARKFLALTVLTLALAACGTSGDDGASDTTTTDTSTTTVADPTTTVADPTTTVADPSSTNTTVADTATPLGGLPPCQELLQQYADAFTPDDLGPIIDLFRSWIPFMPDDVAVATGNLADGYEQAGSSLENLNMADAALTADAEAFSDWTNDGCPAK